MKKLKQTIKEKLQLQEDIKKLIDSYENNNEGSEVEDICIDRVRRINSFNGEISGTNINVSSILSVTIKVSI